MTPSTRRSAARLFGTDGIRGAFGRFPLDEPTVISVGRCLGHLLREDNAALPLVVLGGDTRESTPTITRWLDHGLRSAGASVRHAGTIPTPGVARAVKHLGADAGVVISASHNPYPDNGIKIFDRHGFKFDARAEQRLEERLHDQPDVPSSRSQRGPDPTAPEPELAAHYRETTLGTLTDPQALRHLRIVLDAGNGAASPFAASLFEAAGAEVHLLSAEPNGRNVNDHCGSTAPEVTASTVRERGFDLGFAFDGDADRVILCDERGRIRDGDEILYLWASELAREHQLRPAEIVATSMSNLGLDRSLKPLGISVKRCGVGDREVVDTLRRKRLRLGGEPSGHIVDLALTTTGDGLLSALQLAAMVRARGESVSDLLSGFERLPQILRNVRVRSKPPMEQLPDWTETAEDVEHALGTEGRLVVRYSGTESLARIMVEGPDLTVIESLAERLEHILVREIGED